MEEKREQAEWEREQQKESAEWEAFTNWVISDRSSQVMPSSVAPTKVRRLAPTKSSNPHRAPHAARAFVPRGLSDA